MHCEGRNKISRRSVYGNERETNQGSGLAIGQAALPLTEGMDLGSSRFVGAGGR